ncbi:MAG: MBL fold metallo-hydrolase, partial [Actinobacteria bacterium]|nr:MBL fold metallo-hydrolase [Actinomycetota bacterium]
MIQRRTTGGSVEHRRTASRHTRAANEAVRAALPFEDRTDFDDARRGFVAPLPNDGTVLRSDGWPAWMPSRFNFVNDGEAPDTVNPSLWRQSQLCMIGGLFEVTERLYQVRNVDLSNLTIVEGDSGIIVFDPLITTEAAAAALEVYYAHRPRKPVVAVLYSHSHIDHYGGVKGVVSEEDVESGRVQIIAPVGFLEAAVAENVLAGNVMTRRAMYMYGMLLPADAQGNVGCGLGMATSGGTTTLIPPTVEITETGQKMVIDGLTFEFMLAPDSEAPAEMHWFIEELAAVTAAENCCHTMHNTYTLRGAPIRDPHGWSRYLDETIERWGSKAAVMYGMHHWPVWGSERVIDTLRKGRDGYRFINDETLRLANHGHGPSEIAEMVHLPEGLEHHWAMRGYYGTMSHNVKATYVKYLGHFDGNPAHLHELPPVASAVRYVELMGGAAVVLERASEAFEAGEYRWV